MLNLQTAVSLDYLELCQFSLTGESDEYGTLLFNSPALPHVTVRDNNDRCLPLANDQDARNDHVHAIRSLSYREFTPGVWENTLHQHRPIVEHMVKHVP